MIPLLIYTLFKKFSKRPGAKTIFPGRQYLSVLSIVIFLALVILLFSLIPIKSGAQKQQLNYTVKKDGNKIGWLRIERNVDGNKSVLFLESEIKMRVVFLIKVFAIESAIFENAKLVYSSQFRKINGATKLNKQTRLVVNKYEVLEDGQKRDIVFPDIGTNLLSLYFGEPINILQVYCDNHQCFAPIRKTDDGGYKVNFPDGNSNCYYYNLGVCTKIKISNTFYTATISLNQ